jgi:hypothetical protein
MHPSHEPCHEIGLTSLVVKNIGMGISQLPESVPSLLHLSLTLSSQQLDQYDDATTQLLSHLLQLKSLTSLHLTISLLSRNRATDHICDVPEALLIPSCTVQIPPMMHNSNISQLAALPQLKNVLTSLTFHHCCDDADVLMNNEWLTYLIPLRLLTHLRFDVDPTKIARVTTSIPISSIIQSRWPSLASIVVYAPPPSLSTPSPSSFHGIVTTNERQYDGIDMKRGSSSSSSSPFEPTPKIPMIERVGLLLSSPLPSPPSTSPSRLPLS